MTSLLGIEKKYPETPPRSKFRSKNVLNGNDVMMTPNRTPPRTSTLGFSTPLTSTPNRDVDRRKSTGSPMMLFKKLVMKEKESKKIHETPTEDNIGLKLALPFALDIMQGREPPPRPGSTKKKMHLKENENRDEESSNSSARKQSRESRNPETSKFIQEDEYTLRSCELEPSAHQMSIPSAEQFLMHARICGVVDSYANLMNVTRRNIMSHGDATKLKREDMFDFKVLVGMSRMELEAIILGKAVEKPPDLLSAPIDLLSISDSADAAAGGMMPIHISAGGGSMDSSISDAYSNHCSQRAVVQNAPHPSIVKSLLECGEDLIVEGFFRGQQQYTTSSAGRNVPTGHGVEAAVFSSQRHRQFIVCYRGCLEDQAKPVKNKNAKQVEKAGGVSLLHPAHPVPVNPKFRDAYFSNNIEDKVFALLNKLTSVHPFCDIVTCGHSFGGSLATICGTRYAALCPMMTVSCHAYGAPRVGGKEFRQLTNSLPNLKVMRVEHATDPYVNMPEGAAWMHVGHTIMIASENNPTLNNIIPSPSKQYLQISPKIQLGLKINLQQVSFVRAYRFDERRVENSFFRGSMNIRAKKIQQKRDHEMRSYIHAMEKFTHQGVPWVSKYVGEEGEGVNGMDNEARCVV